MASQSLYRKYRPQTFADVVGQEHIEQTLRNALAGNRVSHAYLFCGPRGTGKTTTARLLAKALLCDQAPTANPDGTCPSCLQIAEGNHPDVYELDAASRTGVDNVREEIIGRVAFAPTQGRYKVYIIDEVHMLSTAAFNALLKTLEEPPAHVVFVLCTTDPQKVPATIISRCQRFDFHRLTTAQIAQCLTQICEGEGFGYDPAAIDLIAQQARGGMRDAITSLEQVAVFGNGNVNFAAAENMFGEVDAVELSEVFGCIARRDVTGCFAWVDRLASTGIDVASVVRSMVAYTRNLYVLKLTGDDRTVVDVSIETLEALRSQVGDFESADRIASLLLTLGDLQRDLRTAVDARLSLEVALTRMAHPVSDLTLEALATRISALESGRSIAAAVPTAAPAETLPQATATGRPAIANAASGAVAMSDAGNRSAMVASTPSSSSGAPSVGEAPLNGLAPGSLLREETGFRVQGQPQPSRAQRATSDVGAMSQQPASGQAKEPSNLAQIMGDSSSLRRIWENVIKAVEKKQPLVPGLLGGSIPHGDYKNRRLVIDLPDDASFGMAVLNGDEVKADMQAALAGMLGPSVRIEYVLGAAAASVDPLGQAPSPTPSVQPVRQAPVANAPWEAQAAQQASPGVQAAGVGQAQQVPTKQQAPVANAPWEAPTANAPWEAPAIQQAPQGGPAWNQAPSTPSEPVVQAPGGVPNPQAPVPQTAPSDTSGPGSDFDEVPLAAYDDIAPTAFSMPAFAADGPAPWEQPVGEPQSPAEEEDEMTSLFRSVFGDHVKFDG